MAKLTKSRQQHLHQTRKVRFQELLALLGVQSALKLGVLEHTTCHFPKQGEHVFNMNIACSVVGCSSIGCIGGSMAMLMGMNEQQASCYVCYADHANRYMHSPSLEPLFFPGISTEKWDDITAIQTITAIQNWLDTGKPHWHKVMKSA